MAASAFGILTGGGAASASTITQLRDGGSHQRLVNRVLARIAPGDHGRILDASTLRITIPDGRGNPRRADYTPVWRAGLAGQELALELPALQQLSIPGITTDPFTHNQRPVGFRRLDELSVQAARRQLAANLQVLAAGLPTTADLRVHTTLVPMALDRRRFAFAVTISVGNLDALHPYYGDLALGPGTGLTGRDEPIEGLAVLVHDGIGRSLGAWSDVRGQQGAIDYGPGDGCFDITLPFRDRQGNPPPGACHG